MLRDWLMCWVYNKVLQWQCLTEAIFIIILTWENVLARDTASISQYTNIVHHGKAEDEASVVCRKEDIFAADSMETGASQVALVVKNPPASEGDSESWVWSLTQEDHLEEGVATHFNIHSWRIPRTEEPGRLWSIGSQRVRHDWSDFTHTHTHTHNMESNFVKQLFQVRFPESRFWSRGLWQIYRGVLMGSKVLGGWSWIGWEWSRTWMWVQQRPQLIPWDVEELEWSTECSE